VSNEQGKGWSLNRRFEKGDICKKEGEEITVLVEGVCYPGKTLEIGNTEGGRGFMVQGEHPKVIAGLKYGKFGGRE